MAELLLELLTEEIPARMQSRAAEDFAALAREKLTAAGLVPAEVQSYSTPRRLTLVVDGLPERQADTTEERRGPRVGAPSNALEGFLKSAGLAAIDQCEARDTGKGVFYFAVIRRPGRAAAEVLPDLLRQVVLELPWPKSMRFPAAGFRWVRPMTSALSLLDGTVLPLALDGVPVGDETRGHRFLAPGKVRVRNVADYRHKLREAHVMLRREDRRQAITLALYERAAEAQLTVKDDPALLDEVTGLVEWPVVLLGRIDAEFLSLPPEVLTTAMRTHQKYFACLDRVGRLAPRFLVTANMIADDGGAAIVAGNERVLRARLSDARFFWEQDRKVALASRIPKLAERVFHARLGSVLDKAGRVMRLAAALAPLVPGAEIAQVRRAAELAKADLSTGMVGEFPELQGVMGRYYAQGDGEPAEVAAAIAEHYSPLGPSDRCPSAPVSVAVALADKIDSLVGFFSIDEKPTGSKDPYALRRAALGVIRLILENRLKLPLRSLFRQAFAIGREGADAFAGDPTADLLGFFADRLKVHLRGEGVRHDLIAAVFALGDEDDLVRLLARVAALDAFLKTDDGANLLVAYRRAANIVRIEEKKDGAVYPGEPDPKLLAEPAEASLAAELDRAARESGDALGREAFTAAMAALARLRGPVDEFFARVTVNCEDRELRANRLRLLAQIRDTLNRVADFSQIEG
ncbi:MAG TPA: glycine--tRNA ligase subunit beta [Stellaceae bacterium]|nr:glycine--tRNA ligase subunit beta [Stellaceae bacterium]